MQATRHHTDEDRTTDPIHRSARLRPPWWLPVVVVPVVVVTVLCTRDALTWVGRPFAGFLFLDNRIVVSIGRSTWRNPAIRRIEWGLVTAVDGATVGEALAIHDAVAHAPVGSDLTYTLRRDADVFRVALPVRRFDRRDFATVFAPMLAVGAWTVAVGAALVVARPEVATLHAAFLVCLTLGLSLITGPDQYGPYRFVSVFYLALALFPASVFHLSAAFLWWPSVWTRRLVAAVYALFAAVGAVLVARRFEPTVFLPLLYLVYFALANTIVLYVGILISAFASHQRLRPQLALALAGVLAPAVVPVVVMVTYPLWTEPVSAPWFVLPIGILPVLHGMALVSLAASPSDAHDTTS